MPRIGTLPTSCVVQILQFGGPPAVLKLACTSARWSWRCANSPEARRQLFDARSSCAIAAGIRDSDAWSLQLWPSTQRDNRYIALVAVARYGVVLQFAADHLRADRELVLAAVAQNGFALQYAAEDLKADKEVVLSAVAQNGHALAYAAAELRADKEVLHVAVAQDGYALFYAAEHLRADK